MPTIEARSTFLESYYPDLGIMQRGGDYFILGEVPLSPYINARSLSQQIDSASPIMNFYAEIANATRLGIGNMRVTSKANYTEIHQLIINYPEFFTPKPGAVLGADHLAQYGGHTVDRRAHLIAVPLRMIVETGFRKMMDSVIHTLAQGGQPLEAVLADAARVRAYMQNSGLRIPDASTVRLADSWWGIGGRPESHIIPHADHMHFFKKQANAAEAILHGDECSKWPAIDSHHVMSALSVTDFDFADRLQGDAGAVWISDMIYAGAVAISIRGSVEPSKVTARELRSNFEKINADMEDEAKRKLLGSAELRKLRQKLAVMAQTYESGGPPILHNATVTAVFNGIKDDEVLLRHSAATLRAPEGFQLPALRSTMLCSNVRLNFTSEEIPAHVIAYSGATSLNTPGDLDGAMVGFDELDLQPAYFDPRRAMRDDKLPFTGCIGSTGSGKTVFGLNLANDIAKLGIPVAFNDLKTHTEGEGHGPFIRSAGGSIISLDDVEGDGGLDPIFVQNGSQFAIDLAHKTIMMINPFGGDPSRYDLALLAALSKGVKEGGAKSCGQALKWASEHGEESAKEIFDLCAKAHESSLLFRFVFGMNPQGKPLSLAEGITLIEVGQVNLRLPDPSKPLEKMLLSERMTLAVVQMMVVASVAAMTGRGGAVFIDEGWVFLKMERELMEQLGRLCRSQRVAPILLTQRATDMSGLKDFISRFFIFGLDSEDEAIEALRLMGEENRALVPRITAESSMPGTRPGENRFNYRSLKALVTSDREVVRGSVCIYKDLNGNITPVVVNIPEEVLLMSSTNGEDIARRDQILAERAQDVDARRSMYADLDALTIATESIIKRNPFEESTATRGERRQAFADAATAEPQSPGPSATAPAHAGAQAAAYDELLG